MLFIANNHTLNIIFGLCGSNSIDSANRYFSLHCCFAFLSIQYNCNCFTRKNAFLFSLNYSGERECVTLSRSPVSPATDKMENCRRNSAVPAGALLWAGTVAVSGIPAEVVANSVAAYFLGMVGFATAEAFSAARAAEVADCPASASAALAGVELLKIVDCKRAESH